MSHNFGWPQDQAAEDALHAERLLFIEEKPFQRVTRRLLDKDSTLRNTPRQLPTPPPDAEESEETAEVASEQPFLREKFWEDVLIDFAALQSSITRIQLIHSSNERERERYAFEKTKILATAQAVRDSAIQLRAQLAEAQKILQLRKGYDDRAAKSLDDKNLKGRDEAKHDIATFEKEIEELQAEGTQLDTVWTTRKDGFEKVIEDTQAFLRVVKGIKDQPEEETKAEEEMDETEDGIKVGSNVGTPRPDGTSTPRAEGGMTPMPTADDVQENTEQDEQQAQSKLREIELSNAPVPTVMVEEPAADVVMEGSQEETAATQVSEQPAVDESVVEEEDSNVVETMDET